MQDKVIEVNQLSRRFSRTSALREVSLTIESGRVYGLVGVNGAGKTTLIKHILGLLRAQHGSVRVFGYDPAVHPVEVLKRIGYLSEERDMPEWMRIDQLMRYTAAFYPQWDWNLANSLVADFRLDIRKKVKDLSKGMRAQVGLVMAVAHRPSLLLLDEPSSGLDAVVRRDILNAIIRTVSEEGRTVIFSSHLLEEVEQMSDDVLMMDHGELVLQGELDQVKESHWRAVVDWQHHVPVITDFENLIALETSGQSWVCVFQGCPEIFKTWCAERLAMVHQVRNASLQEIFLSHVSRQRKQVSEVA